MKAILASLACLWAALAAAPATTITVVPVHQPLSLHGTDADDAISDIGEALQATVMPRPMALTGAFPEVLAESIGNPHAIPTNNPNYQVQEANLLALTGIAIRAKLTEEALEVEFDIGALAIPPEVDLTTRQILRLSIIALRRTLEDYQRPQPEPLRVVVTIAGAEEGRAPLRDIGTTFVVGDGGP